MLEILIIIAVVKAFVKEAKAKNFNKTLWGIIGATSYYIPIFLMSFIVFPFLVTDGYVPITSENQYLLISILVNLVVGVSCCFVAYQILKKSKPNINEADLEILDSDLN